ncbi:Filament-like plant protein 5 [Vitis vinifera]|uniref:Filament-like plant protein 5 n=1 Tax=Vitis vinifera TaxID=29760 RepID=A0A438K665_VITVI|nr:Filament-like plant protein 5 [Vitis vinifera]
MVENNSSCGGNWSFHTPTMQKKQLTTTRPNCTCVMHSNSRFGVDIDYWFLDDSQLQRVEFWNRQRQRFEFVMSVDFDLSLDFICFGFHCVCIWLKLMRHISLFCLAPEKVVKKLSRCDNVYNSMLGVKSERIASLFLLAVIYIVTSEMDRGWPWKKKTSDKTITEKTAATSGSDKASLASVASLRKLQQGQLCSISLDSYTHMTGFEAQVNTLEGQVKILEDQVKDLNKKLSEAHSEITMKESLVEQHAKVAEEAVSGWEKANAEALALKLQLESITLLRLTAEDRASHLDGALKECMRQVRCVKEENEQRLHEVILTKTEQWDKIKLELEGNIVDLDQELLRSSAQNAALSKSLQEHSNMLMKIKEEKFQAEANIEHLKGNIQSYEKEINSLKYELHIVSKELDIRNEEKNMSIKLAEVANKQHLECGKKIAKLEAECQRLRGLQNQKEIEFLTTRLLAMEDETKMLKEALAARNHELQTSRSTCAKVAGRLKSLEATKGSYSTEKLSKIKLWGSLLKVPQVKMVAILPVGKKRLGKSRKHDNSNHLDLMDDFLEMERLAHSSNHSNGVSSIIKDLNNEKGDTACHSTLVDVAKSGNLPSEWPTDSNSSPNQVSSCLESSAIEHGLCVDHLLLLKLQSRISIILESQTKDTDKGKILEEIKCAMQDIQDSMHQQSASCFYEGTHPDDASHNWEACPQDTRETKDSKIFLGEDGKPCTASELKSSVLDCKGHEGETTTFDCIDKVALLENKVVKDESSRQGFPRGCITILIPLLILRFCKKKT